MRKFTILEDGKQITVDEQYIYKNFLPDWHAEMCKKFNPDFVNTSLTVEDCINDFILTYQADEVIE